MKAFIDEHRETFGVEQTCEVLQVALSAYWRYAARRRNSALRSAREQRDEALIPHIERVWHANMRVRRAEKVWNAEMWLAWRRARQASEYDN